MSRKISKIMLLFLLLTLLPALCAITWCAEFPTRPIDLIVPWAPGGIADTMARSLAPKLGEVLGQPVVCINKPGAGGALGAALLAKAKADGHTILFVSNSTLTVAPHFEKVGYNLFTDFTFLCKLYNASPMLVVATDAPWKNFEEFLDFVKKNPRKIKYGTWGPHSGARITMEAMANEKSVEWVHVPFKGESPVAMALLGKHLDAGTITEGSIAQVKAGKLRVLLMLQTFRCRTLPEAPCLRDVGIKFDAKGASEATSGIIAPKGLAEDIIKKYENALEVAAKSPVFLGALDRLGLILHFLPGEEYRKETEDGYKNVEKNVEKLGIK